MTFLPSRTSRKGTVLCFIALLFLFALYQLGIICGSGKDQGTTMMVARETNNIATFYQVMDSAVAAFCLEVIARHGEPAPRLCNKDPLTLKMGSYMLDLFPNAKFLFMVRDGRATVHSIISRKVTITGFDLTSYRQCLTKWNHAISQMHSQCKEVGSDRCLMVPYEQLVLHPREWLKKILNFLDLPWSESVLHHEEYINKPGGVPLSKVERSSDQVIKPINLEALTKWVDNIPEDVVRDMAEIAPMLSVLGYDPYANPPEYGTPDSVVSDNTRSLQNQSH
ncbi:protein-tyrosine sulfotransferase [Fopius arisanus]|uniref:Protein-tyrosine sulfotransferase n=1 Tax=Fopius arisanus TaxID=64838 RepID=A0A9R1TV40_9HYME|nr:PREDICTED: protein-tyrosine sulfotransferase [Fopius arisanus]